MARRRGRGMLAGLLLVAGLAALAWSYREEIRGLVGAEEAAMEISPEAAAVAEAKLERLGEGETVRLSDVELTSLLRYRLRDRISGDLEAPRVFFSGDTVRLAGRFPTDRLPRIGDVDRIRSFLPDTARVEVTGRLRTLEGGRVALEVEKVSFHDIPIPERFYPAALERMGRRDEPGLPPNAYPLHLPEGVGEARVEDGELVLSPAR